jgi:hypothetical protein
MPGSVPWQLVRPTDVRSLGATLTDPIPDPVPAELAPFLATARDRLAADTEGLQPHEVIAHLESTVARAEFEAAQLGIRIEPVADPSDGEDALTAALDDVEGPVVVVRRIISPDDE